MRKQILEINEKLRIGTIKEGEAQRLLLILFGVSESLQLGTFLLQKVTRNDFNNSNNIIFITNKDGEGTDIDINKVFNEAM